MATTEDRQQTPASKKNGAARMALRYGPFLVAAALIGGAIAVFGGGGDDDDASSGGGGGGGAVVTDEDQLIRSGPMTPQRAELEGKTDVDFGPNCDTETEKIKLPMVYAPPCVVPFEGDNGGATTPGVTGDEILVIRYETDPARDPLFAAQIAASGAEVNPETAQQTAEDYVDIYQKVFETYGRTVKVVPFIGSGAGDDAEAARADALAIGDMKPFAVIGGPSRQGPVFASALAAEGVICLGTCPVAVPDSIAKDNSPYIFNNGQTPNQAAALAAEAIGKLAGPGKAELAGDEALQAKDRVYAVVHYDTPDGDQEEVHESLLSELDSYGIKPAVDIKFFLDLNRMQENVRTWVAQMEDAGVTTVIFTGDPLTPAALTKEATAQGFRPEWILGQNVLADQALFGRTFDQEQWVHGFGIGLNTSRGEEETGDPFHIYDWAYDARPPNNTYNIIEPPLRLLYIGIHLAGEKLTPETFRDGLFRYPPTGGGATDPQISRGEHGVWPSIDYGGTDDAALIWYDADEPGVDEVGKDGVGLYRYAKMGQRYTLGHLPDSFEEAGLFDEASSVTIFKTIPAEDVPPDYPPPDL
ncbi:MAG TPA: hypothetical protein VGJ86_14360 [Acidimicrobiales bacterium]|jgi:hypothetical protein